jgi:hypothetical protein
LTGIILLLTNCKSENKQFDKFFENERQKLEISIKEIISLLGLENFEVLVYIHKNINNGIVSKSGSDTNWRGVNYTPEPPPRSEQTNEVVFADMSNAGGWMRQRVFVVNYEPNSKKEITYDSFSVLIIFESISKAKREELLFILDSHIINVERGGNIQIISKEEFNKLE